MYFYNKYNISGFLNDVLDMVLQNLYFLGWYTRNIT